MLLGLAQNTVEENPDCRNKEMGEINNDKTEKDRNKIFRTYVR